MANPFYAQNKGQKQGSKQNMNDMVANMKKINNPQVIKQMIIKKNPQMAQMLNEIENSGMHPVQYIMQQAVARNINISQEQIEQMYNEIASQFN